MSLDPLPLLHTNSSPGGNALTISEYHKEGSGP
jgi:hypothetical protein